MHHNGSRLLSILKFLTTKEFQIFFVKVFLKGKLPFRERNSSPRNLTHIFANDLKHCIFFLIDYNDKETLKKKLTIAISNAEGFGLE